MTATETPRRSARRAHDPVRRRLAFVIAALAQAALFAGFYGFFVRSEFGQTIDEHAIDGARRWFAPVGGFGEAALEFTLPIAIIGVTLTAVWLGVRMLFPQLVVLVGSAVLANASVQALKQVLLERPDYGLPVYPENSLPSGHTALAATAAFLLIAVAPAKARPFIGVAATAFVTLTGAATFVALWHRPSDVLAALLVVGVWACLAAAVLPRRSLAAPRRQSRGWMTALVITALLAAALLVVTGLAVSAGASATAAAALGGLAAVLAGGVIAGAAAVRWLPRLG